MRLFVLCLALAAACTPAATRRPYAGTLPTNTALDMGGAFKLSPQGELRLALTTPCKGERSGTAIRASTEVNCDRALLDQIPVVARAPWGAEFPGTWNGPAYVVFQIDWKAADLDPLADDAADKAARPWTVSGAEWQPTPDDAKVILQRIGEATGIETDVVRGGAAPGLDVAAFEVEGGSLRVGDATSLTVKIVNRGPGTAYRVAATTRSSIDALHGKRLSFGTIKPGADKTRKIELALPAGTAERDTMLVLAVSEANTAAPKNISHRVQIAPSTAAPALATRCTILGHDGPKPDVDAGQSLMVRCQVDNTGNAEAKQVTLDAAIGNAKGRSMPQPVPAAGHASIDVAITVPRDLPMNSPFEIAVTARDAASSRTARATVSGVVRKPRMCTPGQLTRAQYQAKITELRAAVTAGDITQAQLDKYDAELVACLK